VSTTRWPVRQWRIVAAADRTAPEPFFHCRVSRREQSLRPSHTVVTDNAAAHRAGLRSATCSRREERRG
jgi:hypothetical protein